MSQGGRFKIAFAAVALAVSTMPDAIAATCEDLAALDIPYATITVAQSVPAGSFQPPTGNPIADLPAFCRVALTMAPSADSSIRVEVWMPTSAWTGRFQGLGCGGYCSTLNYGALGNALRARNATAHTDMGTALPPVPGGAGLGLVGHPEKWLDFGSNSWS